MYCWPLRRRTSGLRERFRLPTAAVAMAAPAPGLISVFSSPQELGASLAQLVAQRAACCLAGGRARFALGLSGGSLVSMLARELPAAVAPAGPVSLARWTLGFCDERLVPFDHGESTYGLYRVRATGAAGGHAERAASTAYTPATEAAGDHGERAAPTASPSVTGAARGHTESAAPAACTRPRGPLGVKARGPCPLPAPRLRGPLGVKARGPRPLPSPRLRGRWGSCQEGRAHCLDLGYGAHWGHAKRALPTTCFSATGDTEGRDERARPPPEPRLQCGSSRISLRSLPLSRQGWKWSACSSSSYFIWRSIRGTSPARSWQGIRVTHVTTRPITQPRSGRGHEELGVEPGSQDFAQRRATETWERSQISGPGVHLSGKGLQPFLAGGLTPSAFELNLPPAPPPFTGQGACCALVTSAGPGQAGLPIPESQVITINPELPVEEAAEDYAKKLSQSCPGEPEGHLASAVQEIGLASHILGTYVSPNAFQGDSIPVFDLLILGVGPDGHTCSLFPDHPLLQEREKIVAPISDSPKPPTQRVTLTLPVLNAARTVIFVATGEGKAAVLKRILEDKEENPLPAALVQPHTGKLCWFLDEAAARLLTVPFEKHSTL
ncbi:hypothetical protein P7K49_033576 [Saguinus oedipus]|uniref:Glucosamine/galactosamine-6-phosphate isomerase domain-containing protein n=1 Tax=Saguinus oedipus TaxID=9490 RepID=A0ABQ9TSR5_SAGOE|nr:hypothetical protein P7K49_033576 [Saguinus oedipus]